MVDTGNPFRKILNLKTRSSEVIYIINPQMVQFGIHTLL